MKRRDSERNHAYASEVISSLSIYDIQGLLKEGEVFKCGIEAYQVADFSMITFDGFNQEAEQAKFTFCSQLGIPYFIIVTSEATKSYQIYISRWRDGNVVFDICYRFHTIEFISWWRSQQSFEQKKAMYNAGDRLSGSIIDRDLFSHALAWGVNIDGFSLGTNTGSVRVIFEKRICTYSADFNISNYDPDKYFHGTVHRMGDYPSWKLLFELSKKLNASLILFTFDTGNNKCVGATRVLNINEQNGITYKGNVKPYENLYDDDVPGLKTWLKSNA